MSDQRVIAPFNQCELTGLETQKPCNFPDVVHYVDHVGRVRLVYKNICGVILDVDGTIDQVYTVPSERKQGLAKQILALAVVLGYKPKHSDYLTTDGAAFAANVSL